MNIPENNHKHELSKFDGGFPVMNLNNMAGDQEQHSKRQVAGKKRKKMS